MSTRDSIEAMVVGMRQAVERMRAQRDMLHRRCHPGEPSDKGDTRPFTRGVDSVGWTWWRVDENRSLP